jgi:hypothetical protein
MNGAENVSSLSSKIHKKGEKHISQKTSWRKKREKEENRLENP